MIGPNTTAIVRRQVGHRNGWRNRRKGFGSSIRCLRFCQRPATPLAETGSRIRHTDTDTGVKVFAVLLRHRDTLMGMKTSTV